MHQDLVVFPDRVEAGRRLAERLRYLKGSDVVVLGLPRGGVPVAAEVAAALDAPLDVVVVRKLGLPWHPELAMGALGEGGVVVRNEEVLALAHVSEHDLDRVRRREQAELDRRAARFRAGLPPVAVAGRTAVLVDDGIATGSTARAACRVVRALGAARVVVAVPVAPPDTVRALADEADEVVCLQAPALFSAVGEWYADFTQTGDDEVVALLAQARSRTSAQHRRAGPRDEEVKVRAGSVTLAGRLMFPADPTGVVVLAHGTGSSRHSPRNTAVARALVDRGLATLLLDLLTPEEQPSGGPDVPGLADRLSGATRWVRGSPDLGDLPVGYFGASSGAAVALWAAAAPDADVAAVVSRGGRPDLAEERLAHVRAPVLLVVGSRDEAVLELNRRAQGRLRCPSRLDVVPGASHLFAEPGALATVAELAGDWLVTHLSPAGLRSRS